MTENRKHFIDELNGLNDKVIEMGKQVFDSYVKLMSVCEHNDLDLASEIVDRDKLINELEVSINVDGYLLIAKQCPVASDLRRIITALKISNELERIGDYAVNIAKFILKTQQPNKSFSSVIIKLTTIFVEMLKEIMIAFETKSVQHALDVNDQDEILDDEYKKSVREFIKIAKNSNEEEIEESMRALLVIKQIERAGDHVTNIAENIVYLVNGKRIELN